MICEFAGSRQNVRRFLRAVAVLSIREREYRTTEGNAGDFADEMMPHKMDGGDCRSLEREMWAISGRRLEDENAC
jgi:hypothetical protein